MMTYWKECHDETEMGLHGLIGRHGCRQVWVKPVEGVLVEDTEAAVERMWALYCSSLHPVMRPDEGFKATLAAYLHAAAGGDNAA
jgi:hypothetical protein